MLGVEVFGLVGYEDLPPLLPISDDIPPFISDFRGFEAFPTPPIIERENPIKDIMVGWEDVDVGYIEKLAIVHFNQRYPRSRPRLNYNETQIFILRVLHELERQASQSSLTLNTCCTNSGCVALNFLDCVLDACKDVFRETEFF